MLVESLALPVRVADTTGAGDAFAAGLLSALIDGAEVVPAMARAAELGAAAAAVIGGCPVTTFPDTL